MSDVWTAFIAAGSTLVGALGTTWLTGHYAHLRDSTGRAERFQAEQRRAIVELLHAGTAWMDATFSSMVAVALAANPGDRDAAQRLTAAGEAEATMVRALTEARLLINDVGLRAKFSELEATRRMAAQCSNANITAAAKRRGQNPVASLDMDTEPGEIEDAALAALGPTVVQGHAAILKAREVLNDIEQLANERLTP